MKEPMHAFSFVGIGGEKLELTIQESIGLNYTGEYEFKGTVEISAGNYHVRSNSYFFFDVDLFAFGDSLSSCYQAQKGVAVYQPKRETCLSFKLEMEKGCAHLRGNFQERYDVQNVLTFEFPLNHKSLLSSMHDINSIRRSISQLK